MRKSLPLVLASVLLASAVVHPALADDWHGHDDHGWHDHGGDIHRFGDHDYDHWRAGHWLNGDHEGRHGWWWIVDGAWYFYPTPVYPFPDPYTPPVVAVAPAPVGTIGAPPAYAYLCKNPVGYYPYVPQCFGHWHRVVTGTTTIVEQQQPAAVVVQQPAPAAVATPQRPPATYVPPSSSKADGEREADEHRLNEYAADFQNIDPTGQQAAGRLEALDKKVEEFRQSLFKRGYNAIEVSKNAEDLEHRIHEEKEHLGAPPPGLVPPPQ